MLMAIQKEKMAKFMRIGIVKQILMDRLWLALRMCLDPIMDLQFLNLMKVVFLGNLRLLVL